MDTTIEQQVRKVGKGTSRKLPSAGSRRRNPLATLVKGMDLKKKCASQCRVALFSGWSCKVQ